MAALVIAHHPFPKTVFKEKKLSEIVEVLRLFLFFSLLFVCAF
jgi:hypothetical protein